MFNRDGDVAVVLRPAKNGGSFGEFETRGIQMLNHETELKMQAHLDGELASGEAYVIRELFGRKNVAPSLFQGLHVALLTVALFSSGCAHYRVNAPFWGSTAATGSIAQEQEIDLLVTGQVAIVETAERDPLSAASPERLA